MEKKIRVLYVVRLSDQPSFYFLFSHSVALCTVPVPPQGSIKFIYPCSFQVTRITTQTAIITAADVVVEL